MRIFLAVLCLMILSGLTVGLYTTGHWLAATLIITHIFAACIGVVIGVIVSELL